MSLSPIKIQTTNRMITCSFIAFNSGTSQLSKFLSWFHHEPLGQETTLDQFGSIWPVCQSKISIVVQHGR
uniref:Uncharacterized protein n=1 Tax=Rhizophora mucronata TaxID=61149 RepID=A0A2P2K008_RHIMU